MKKIITSNLMFFKYQRSLFLAFLIYLWLFIPQAKANPENFKKNHLTTNLQELITVTGKVVQKNEKGQSEPLLGVTIKIKESNQQFKSDGQGNFMLKMKANQNLVFSSVGFQSKTILISKSEINLQVVLQTDSHVFDEVVVTGYQKIDKKSFTGSVVKVNSDLVNRSGTGDISKMLQGAAAGVTVENTSGTFGTTPKIRIRGSASISANQEPLYVVNGVPIATPTNLNSRQLYSGDPATLLSSAIAGLNANDIEDIQILKDGSATALYGTRAANGVISITTKKGKNDSKMTVNLSSAFSVGVKPSISQFNVLNSDERMDLATDLYNRGYLSVLNYPSATGAFTEAYSQYAENKLTKEGEDPALATQRFNAMINRARSVNTDWFDVLFRNNLVQEHGLSFSGGDKNTTYYISGSYLGDDGQAIGYKTQRYTNDMRLVLNITPKLTLDLNSNVSYRDQRTPGNFSSTTNSNFDLSRPFELNPSLYAANTSRAMSPYDENGNLMYYKNNYAPFNILEELNENFNNLNSYQASFRAQPNYKITDKLTFTSLMSYSQRGGRNEHIATERSNVVAAYKASDNDQIRALNTYLYRDVSDPNAIPEPIIDRGGIITETGTKATSLYMRNTLDYKNDWNDRKHVLSVFGGAEIAADRLNSIYHRGYGYLYYGGKLYSPSILSYMRARDLGEKLDSVSNIMENRVGAFANVQYGLMERYNFEVGGRVDGNNLFGQRTQQRFLPNYSFGFSWNAEKETFFKDWGLNKFVDNLKLRASYALRGNAFQTSPQLNANYVNLNRRDAANSEIAARVYSPELYNLSWEKDYIANFGLELGLFKKVNLVLEYYDRRNKDLINFAPVGAEEGFTQKTINYASMYNKGVDVTLDVRDIVKSDDFSWGINTLFSYVKNRLTNNAIQANLLTSMTNPLGFASLNHPLVGLYAYKYAGLDNTGQPLFYDATGNKVTDIPLTSQNAGFVEYVGPREPTISGSFTNSFKYKDLELRIFFTYSTGNKVFRSPIAADVYQDNQSLSRDLVNRWRSPGDEQYTNIPGLISNIQATYNRVAFINRPFLYNRSTAMVVDASVVRLSEVMMSYALNKEFLQKKYPWLKSAKVMLSANNIYYWASPELRGVDPQTLITGINLPNPRTFSIRLLVSF